MATDGLLLKIADMIDLAIGSPEVGTVDFNMLHNVLHCFAQQMSLLEKNVELKIPSYSLPPASLRDNAHTVVISEVPVDQENEQDTVLVVERVKKTGTTPTPGGGGAGAGGGVGGGAGGGPKSSSAATEAGRGAGRKSAPSDRLSLVTMSQFDMLRQDVNNLKNRVFQVVPTNDAILEGVRSQTNVNAINEVWQNININSRMEAIEQGLNKLGSLVQDLITGSPALQEFAKTHGLEDFQPIVPPTTGGGGGAGVGGIGGTGHGGAAGHGHGAGGTGYGGMGGRADALLRQLKQDVDALFDTLQGMGAAVPERATVGGSTRERDMTTDYDEEGGTEGSEFRTDREFGGTGGDIDPALRQYATRNSKSAGLWDKVEDLEKRLTDCCENNFKESGVVADQLQSFQNQIMGLQKQIATMEAEIEHEKLPPEMRSHLEAVIEMAKTINEIRQQLRGLKDVAAQLVVEKEERLARTNALLEQIELLKTVKLDREDMIEAMSEKADLRMLARKVSHDQFEMACEDLTKGLQSAINKVSLQEELWQQALDDIQREIESKLDKYELSPVKEFFNSKLQALQDTLKKMAAMRREAEAAGTKKKLLRDVNCISCDAPAVMPMVISNEGTKSNALPPSMSMKPYLTYELDTIRKQQATNVPQRNLHDWEIIDKQMNKPKGGVRPKTAGPDKHLCNRYCGGSHTLTTAAQRVARTGHFVKQWGPDVLPLGSTLAAGDDGRMYQVNTLESANVGPGGSVDDALSTKPRRESIKPPVSKPTILEEQCRCLFEDKGKKG